MVQSVIDFNPPIGKPELLETNVRRILAPNPSPMTYRGTNTYLVGKGNIGVVDPGPQSQEHLQAILSAIEPEQKITHILVTHSHIDHSPLAIELSQMTEAKIYGFGPTGSGQSDVMHDLIASGYEGGGEGRDEYFQPDVCIKEGDEIIAEGWKISVLHTPGHFANHVTYTLNDIAFTGDHIMDWASSMVSPPDGDLADFMASCRKLQQRDWRVFYPGHGAPVQKPDKRLEWLISHRLGREAQILETLKQAPMSPHTLSELIYKEIPQDLLGAAARNVFAHLIDLHRQKQILCDGPPRFNKVFSRAEKGIKIL